MNKLASQIKIGLVSPRAYKSPIKFNTNHEIKKDVKNKIHYTPKSRVHKSCNRKLQFDTNISKSKEYYVNYLVDKDHISSNIPSITINPPETCNDNESILDVDCSFFTTQTSKNSLIFNTPERFYLSANGIRVDKSNGILGRGSFGVIVPGVYKDQNIALKIIPITRIEKKPFLIREKNALGLSHPNVVKVLNVIYNTDSTFVTVLMENCSVFDNLQYLIDDHDYFIDNFKKVKFTVDLCNGLGYCHSQNILHLDIKPLNILINADGYLKICDFGASIKTTQSEQYENYKNGTVRYTAPEILMGLKPTEKSDIYSIGVTMWQLHYRKTPYEGFNNEIIIYNVVKKHLRPQIIKTVQDKYAETFQSCWASKPDDRPATETILKCLKKIDARNIRIRRSDLMK